MKKAFNFLPAAVFLGASVAAQADDQMIVSGVLKVVPVTFSNEDLTACFDALVQEQDATGGLSSAVEAKAGEVICGGYFVDHFNSTSFYTFANIAAPNQWNDIYNFYQNICPNGTLTAPQAISFGIETQPGLFLTTDNAYEINYFRGVSDLKGDDIILRTAEIAHNPAGPYINVYDTLVDNYRLNDGTMIDADGLTAMWRDIHAPMRQVMSMKDNNTLNSFVAAYLKEHPDFKPASCALTG